MRRYLSSFMLTLTAYTIGAALAIFFLLVDDKENKNIKIIDIDKVCLTTIVSKVQPQIEQKSPPIEQKIQETPQPKPKPVIKKAAIKPVVKEEKTLQEPLPQPIEEARIQDASKEIVPKTEPVKKEEKEIQPHPKPAVDFELLEAKREKFIAELIKRINNNKSYPNSARRRAIEGEVEVAFAIASNGSVHDIEFLSGHDIFKNSAIEAIQNSFPIHVEDGLFEFPKKFKISILYILN